VVEHSIRSRSHVGHMNLVALILQLLHRSSDGNDIVVRMG
jgi:hypothetical protein